MPAYPGCTPQSNMTLLPLYATMWQERPTSEPAPKGMISRVSSSPGAPPATTSMERFTPAVASMGVAIRLQARALGTGGACGKSRAQSAKTCVVSTRDEPSTRV